MTLFFGFYDCGFFQTGIIIQSIVTTIVVLAAYYIGLIWHTPEDIFTRDEELLMAARTMAFVTMSMAELTRAYTVRHNRQSVFTIGVWGNSFMQYAVFGSASLVIFVASTPGVRTTGPFFLLLFTMFSPRRSKASLTAAISP